MPPPARKNQGAFTITCGTHSVSGVTAEQLSSLPGSLLADCIELEVKNRTILLPVDLVSPSLLEAGVRAYTRGKVLVPETASLAQVQELVDYKSARKGMAPYLIRQRQSTVIVEKCVQVVSDHILAAILKAPAGQNPLQVGLSLKDLGKGACPDALKREVAVRLKAEGYTQLLWRRSAAPAAPDALYIAM